MEFIDLKSQFLANETAIRNRIDKVLAHGSYIMGPEVKELEKKLASFVGRKHTITCANGTDAIQLALMALDIGPGDKVITTPFSFFATAEAISIVGASPLFVDIDMATFNLCSKRLREKLNNISESEKAKIKAVLSVDLFGMPSCTEELEDICRDNKLWLIEDAAQGFGGAINNRKNCSFGIISTTSFFPAKPLGCYGDGGAIFVDDDKLEAILRSLRVHGKGRDKYDNVRIGLNSRLDTLQAAILLEKLKIFEDELKLRANLADKYYCNLSSILTSPSLPKGFTSSWAQYTLLTKNTAERHALMDYLHSFDIPTAIYYPVPIHLSKAYEKYKSEPMPVSEDYSRRCLSIPMHPYLTDQEQQLIIQKIKEFYA